MQPAHHQINKLNNILRGSISSYEEDRILQYDNNVGTGRIVSVALKGGITYTDYTMDLMESLEIKLHGDVVSALYFIYCMEGSVFYEWENYDRSKNKIVELQTAILGSEKSSLKLHVPKEEISKFTIIKIDRIVEIEEDDNDDFALNKKLFHQFLGLNGEEPFEYQGSFNLRIKEQLLQIQSIKQKGVIRKLLVGSIIHFTLALELMHHLEDTEMNETNDSALTTKELIRIKAIIEAIEKNPQYNYSIDSLCKEYGFAASKLQEGFKVLQGSTVSHFIRRKRLEMAEKLIKKGDLNISQVVYTVGFTSRSYFSKIFKNRYHYTPKYYQENCKNIVST